MEKETRKQLSRFFNQVGEVTTGLTEYEKFCLIQTDKHEYYFYYKDDELYLVGKNSEQIKVMYPYPYIEQGLF